MSERARYWIYGTVISAVAIGTGLLTNTLLDFHWVIVSMLLLGLANIFTLTGRYHVHRPNVPPAPTQAGTTLVNAIVVGEPRIRHVPKRRQPQDRFTWLSQPTLVAAIAIIAIVLLG